MLFCLWLGRAVSGPIETGVLVYLSGFGRELFGRFDALIDGWLVVVDVCL